MKPAFSDTTRPVVRLTSLTPVPVVNWDAVGVMGSLACLAHCLLLPLAVGVLPWLILFEGEWLVVALTAPALFALISGWRTHGRWVLIVSPCSLYILGHPSPQNDCARRQVCLRRPGQACVRHDTLLRSAPWLPQCRYAVDRLALCFVYARACAQTPTKPPAPAAIRGLPACARLRVAFPGWRPGFFMVSGLVTLNSAAFAAPENWEAGLTVLGGLLLIGAHGLNYHFCRCCLRCADGHGCQP